MDTESAFSTPQEPANKKSGLSVFLAVSLIAVVAVGIYYLKSPSDTPPSLEVDSSAFQGALYGDIDEKTGFHKFTKLDEYTGYYEEILGDSSEVSKGVHFFTAKRDLSVDNIMGSIIPPANMQVLFASYRDGDFYTYPKGPYANTIEVKDSEDAKDCQDDSYEYCSADFFVERGETFILISSDDYSIANVVSEDKESGFSLSVPNSFTGWKLAHGRGDLGNDLEDYKDRVVSVWPMTDANTFDEKLEDGEWEDYETDGYYVFWVKFGEKDDDPEGTPPSSDDDSDDDDGDVADDDDTDDDTPEETAVCGDGTVDEGEECDDGNTADDDGCSSTCQDEEQETQTPAAVCGNDTLDDGELCEGEFCKDDCSGCVNDDIYTLQSGSCSVNLSGLKSATCTDEYLAEVGCGTVDECDLAVTICYEECVDDEDGFSTCYGDCIDDKVEESECSEPEDDDDDSPYVTTDDDDNQLQQEECDSLRHLVMAENGECVCEPGSKEKKQNAASSKQPSYSFGSNSVPGEKTECVMDDDFCEDGSCIDPDCEGLRFGGICVLLDPGFNIPEDHPQQSRIEDLFDIIDDGGIMPATDEFEQSDITVDDYFDFRKSIGDELKDNLDKGMKDYNLNVPGLIEGMGGASNAAEFFKSFINEIKDELGNNNTSAGLEFLEAVDFSNTKSFFSGQNQGDINSSEFGAFTAGFFAEGVLSGESTNSLSNSFNDFTQSTSFESLEFSGNGVNSVGDYSSAGAFASAFTASVSMEGGSLSTTEFNNAMENAFAVGEGSFSAGLSKLQGGSALHEGGLSLTQGLTKNGISFSGTNGLSSTSEFSLNSALQGSQAVETQAGSAQFGGTQTNTTTQQQLSR